MGHTLSLNTRPQGSKQSNLRQSKSQSQQAPTGGVHRVQTKARVTTSQTGEVHYTFSTLDNQDPSIHERTITFPLRAAVQRSRLFNADYTLNAPRFKELLQEDVLRTIHFPRKGR